MAVDARALTDDDHGIPGFRDVWYELARALGCSAPEAAQWAMLASRQLHYPTDRQEYIDQLQDHLDARVRCRSWRLPRGRPASM